MTTALDLVAARRYPDTDAACIFEVASSRLTAIKRQSSRKAYPAQQHRQETGFSAISRSLEPQLAGGQRETSLYQRDKLARAPFDSIATDAGKWSLRAQEETFRNKGSGLTYESDDDDGASQLHSDSGDSFARQTKSLREQRLSKRPWLSQHIRPQQSEMEEQTASLVNRRLKYSEPPTRRSAEPHPYSLMADGDYLTSSSSESTHQWANSRRQRARRSSGHTTFLADDIKIPSSILAVSASNHTAAHDTFRTGQYWQKTKRPPSYNRYGDFPHSRYRRQERSISSSVRHHSRHHHKFVTNEDGGSDDEENITHHQQRRRRHYNPPQSSKSPVVPSITSIHRVSSTNKVSLPDSMEASLSFSSPPFDESKNHPVLCVSSSTARHNSTGLRSVTAFSNSLAGLRSNGSASHRTGGQSRDNHTSSSSNGSDSTAKRSQHAPSLSQKSSSCPSPYASLSPTLNGALRCPQSEAIQSDRGPSELPIPESLPSPLPRFRQIVKFQCVFFALLAACVLFGSWLHKVKIYAIDISPRHLARPGPNRRTLLGLASDDWRGEYNGPFLYPMLSNVCPLYEDTLNCLHDNNAHLSSIAAGAPNRVRERMSPPSRGTKTARTLDTDFLSPCKLHYRKFAELDKARQRAFKREESGPKSGTSSLSAPHRKIEEQTRQLLMSQSDETCFPDGSRSGKKDGMLEVVVENEPRNLSQKGGRYHHPGYQTNPPLGGELSSALLGPHTIVSAGLGGLLLSYICPTGSFVAPPYEVVLGHHRKWRTLQYSVVAARKRYEELEARAERELVEDRIRRSRAPAEVWWRRLVAFVKRLLRRRDSKVQNNGPRHNGSRTPLDGRPSFWDVEKSAYYSSSFDSILKAQKGKLFSISGPRPRGLSDVGVWYAAEMSLTSQVRRLRRAIIWAFRGHGRTKHYVSEGDRALGLNGVSYPGWDIYHAFGSDGILASPHSILHRCCSPQCSTAPFGSFEGEPFDDDFFQEACHRDNLAAESDSSSKGGTEASKGRHFAPPALSDSDGEGSSITLNGLKNEGKSSEEALAILRDRVISSFQNSGGFLSPCYPLRTVLRRLLTSTQLYLVLFIPWCHSLFSYHPLTLVHIPRLLAYVIISIYRYVALYYFGSYIEQHLLGSAFDYSDNIVLYLMIVLIASIECVAAERSHFPRPRQPPRLANREMDDNSSVPITSPLSARALNSASTARSHNNHISSDYQAAAFGDAEPMPLSRERMQGQRQDSADRYKGRPLFTDVSEDGRHSARKGWGHNLTTTASSGSSALLGQQLRHRRSHASSQSATALQTFAEQSSPLSSSSSSAALLPPMQRGFTEVYSSSSTNSLVQLQQRMAPESALRNESSKLEHHSVPLHRSCRHLFFSWPELFVKVYYFVVCLSACYAAFFTAFYFHHPRESIAGIGVAFFGLYLPFWLLLLSGCLTLERLGLLRYRDTPSSCHSPSAH